MKIVFMGTPDYSVPTLKALLQSNNEILAVFTQPDKAVGRKQILTPPPVKKCAEENDIPVFQPTTLKDGEALNILKELSPDVIIVVAYGKILPKEILSLPKYGCINAHASLLPKYRGASPIQWSIVCGEKITGITLQIMDEGIDTGDILDTVEIEIGENETAEELFERLSVISADLTVKIVNKLTDNDLKPKKQIGEASYAPIIKKEMARLDFVNKTANQIHNAIRGYYSWPCAFFTHGGKRIKVLSSLIGNETNLPAGSVIENTDELVIACKDRTSIRLINVQPEGSKPMTSKQMLCGNKIALGTVIGE